MECPLCHGSVPFISCPECGGEAPEKSLYCCWCGRALPGRERKEIDFSDRVPCSDGTCIGTINEQRVCSVCGKSFAGEGV